MGFPFLVFLSRYMLPHKDKAWPVVRTAYKIHEICPVSNLRNNLKSFKVVRVFDCHFIGKLFQK